MVRESAYGVPVSCFRNLASSCMHGCSGPVGSSLTLFSALFTFFCASKTFSVQARTRGAVELVDCSELLPALARRPGLDTCRSAVHGD